ncbi:hypothetical protein MCEMIEM28_01353 [Burkholderiaceae bacterium]
MKTTRFTDEQIIAFLKRLLADSLLENEVTITGEP